ncbi:MAG TPA: BamA/TamA family outer membrane protein [Gemmatimonadaceae bacterium]|nr:BamA/TamA family outer membrane protein [Gemmatimonadaceae bacterium]
MRARLLLRTVAALGLLAPGARVRAQIPYHVFNDATQISALAFRFASAHSFPVSRLQQEMALSGPRRFDGVRRALAFLPAINKPAPHPFTPLDLQRDVARLRRFYETSGFIGTKISYEVAYDNTANRVRVTMIVDEGRPVTLHTATIVLEGGGDPETVLPLDLQSAWRRFVAHTGGGVGRRFTGADRARVSGEALGWWMDRGWAFARSSSQTTIDSGAATLDMRVELHPGPRARVDSLEVVGNTSVSRGVVLRTMPLAKGDWFSTRKLADGQRRLFGLSLFRVALTNVPRNQHEDSTVRVQIQLKENLPRLITGELGYGSSGEGVTVRGELTHRNFTGGARTLRLTAVAQTGALAFSVIPERDYEFAISFHEPYLTRREVSFTVSPFVRYRDDPTDRSQEAGIETSVIYDMGKFRFLTLQHRYSARRVLEYRIGTGSSTDLAALLAIAARGGLADIGTRIQRSTFELSGTVGRADPSRSARAMQMLPSILVTAPRSLNTIEFAHAELPLSVFVPLRKRVALSANARWGRVYPFGKTTNSGSSADLENVQLREALLSAGGSGSVRGWGGGMLGPKLLNLRFETLPGSDSIRVIGTNGYIPAGGLARASGSVEMQMPFPGLGTSWGTHVFLDAGRVWSPDARFALDTPSDEQRWFFGIGGGVDYATIVGPVRLSIGYKLNPSVLDLRSAADVFKAIAAGLPASSAPVSALSRLHLHVSLGQRF